MDNGCCSYLFEDSEIRRALEDHHIKKVTAVDVSSQCSEDNTSSDIEYLETRAREGNGSCITNSDFTDSEVRSTFGKGSITPGPDGISTKLVDNADREVMHNCLKVLWNRAWSEGYFFTEWKKENRVVIPKIWKDDYHECGAYRTVAIATVLYAPHCLGKRMEYITSRRLMGVLEDQNFDTMQFAYLQNRSATHALLLLIEMVKSEVISGNKAGVIYFDFRDAFGTVDRNILLRKLGCDFGISGRLFLHIQSFLKDGFARIKVNGKFGDWIE